MKESEPISPDSGASPCKGTTTKAESEQKTSTPTHSGVDVSSIVEKAAEFGEQFEPKEDRYWEEEPQWHPPKSERD